MPIVAALNGPAVGLGASIALLCDVIFMADTASIADPHVRVGIVAGDGGTAIWPLVLGPARAKEFLLTGDKVDAATAERIGLVNHVVPAAELMDAARAFADRLAAGAPLALRYTKLAVNKWIKTRRERRLRRRDRARDRDVPERRPPGSARGDSRETQAGVQGTLRLSAGAALVANHRR